MSTAPSPYRFRFSDIAALHRQLRTVDGSVLLRSIRDDLAVHGRALNAVAELPPEVSSNGGSGRSDRRPLAGIPYGIKDVFDTRGIPTRHGSPIFVDNVPDRDAAVVERLGAAGAVLVAKLSAIQLAGAGGYRFPSTSLDGVGKNPWNERHWSGGSSSGSAIAVSAGLLPFAIGTETTGSVLVPAAFCGVTGFRPSWGAVSQRGMLPVAWSLDKPGVVARTAADCRTVFQALVGEDAEDRTTSTFHLQPAIQPPFSIGVLDIGFEGFPDASDRFIAAVDVLREAGDRTASVTAPPGPYQETVRTILAGETAASQGWIVRTGKVRGMLDASQRAGLRASLGQTAAAYSSATRTRVELVAGLRAMLRSHDAIVAPTHLSEAPPIGTDLKNWAPRRRHLGAIGALGGFPGVTVPIGFGPGGLPLGMTVLGDRGRDLTILAVAERFQALTDWHRKSPEPGS